MRGGAEGENATRSCYGRAKEEEFMEFTPVTEILSVAGQISLDESAQLTVLVALHDRPRSRRFAARVL